MSAFVGPGATLRDNDPRMPDREVVVERVCERYAYCRHAKYPSFPKVRIMLSSIYSDGKPRRSGFSLIPPNAVAQPPAAPTTEDGNEHKT